jgi:hypothetical protein
MGDSWEQSEAGEAAPPRLDDAESLLPQAAAAAAAEAAVKGWRHGAPRDALRR